MDAINKTERENARLWLREYVARIGSQNKAAKALGVSAATLSNIENEKWDLLNTDMIRKIAAAVRPTSGAGWQVVQTHALKEIFYVMNDARLYCNVHWVVGESGCGKTTAATHYAQTNPNVFYILCSEDMRKSDFVRGVASSMGLSHDGLNVRETLALVTRTMVTLENPLLIIDEGDKPLDNVFHYYINLYNLLEDKCGFVFLSTPYIKRRISSGLRIGKKGYKEIDSRIGRKFAELDHTTARDVEMVCRGNGVTNPKEIDKVVRETQDYFFDFRAVKKKVHYLNRIRTATP